MLSILTALTGVFIAVALAAGWGTFWVLARTSAGQRRVRQIAPSGSAGVLAAQQHLLLDGPDPALARLTRIIPKSTKDMSRLQRRLAQAGYPRTKALVWYLSAQLVLAACGAVVMLGMWGLGGWLYAAIAGGFGYLLPSLYISRRTAKRQKAISNGLPDALDLLLVCVEAGGGLDQAMAKAAEELRLAHRELAEELQLVTTEVRAGKTRAEAFKNLAKRTAVEDVRSLVAMLSQTDRFGTSIGEALRTHADTSRTKRRQRAEERAAKVGVKLVFPLALCLFPALYVVCFGPVVVKIYRAFFTSGL